MVVPKELVRQLQLAWLSKVSLTLIARNESVLKEVVNTLDTSLAQNHNYLCVDFADNQFAKKIEILEKTNYDILINNTGGPASGPIADASAEDFLLAFKMHLLNNQILIQKVVGGMKKFIWENNKYNFYFCKSSNSWFRSF